MPMSPRLLRPVAAGGFNPKRLAGLEAWYDATVASSVTLTNGFVSRWDDLSGNNLHLEQSVEADRPTLGTLSSKPAIDFDGSNDYMDFPSLPPDVGTMFVAMDRDSAVTVSNGRVIATVRSVTLNRLNATLISDAGDLRIASSVDATVVFASNTGLGGFPDSVPLIISCPFGATSRFNGTPMTGSSAGAASTVSGIVLGARRTAIGTASPHDGRIGEFIAYSRVLTLAEIQQVERYLATKWGISLP
jgi:hypothetical protein